MSGAADKLPSGDDPAPNSVLTGTIGFLNAGGTLGTLLQGAIFGTLVSVFTEGVNVIQSFGNLVVSPIDATAEATIATISATIIEPLGIVETSAAASATSIGDQFGPFAFIVGIVVLLAGFWIIIQFLEEDETSDTFIVPGFPDLPFVGVDEENDEG
ncbi:hypothetical protein C461_04687 [Halorubrum aidingense JCM 13560]|uniref:Uncharacterized protein n=1 Tax=Halorubrum aidingense JCM 13560 TaxID=1230454 RepID=M0PG61_9EURY|nr:hypothetical protein [Halorubrum aidingense]EMA68898.1 hypothetical protein C461_04687 [Halorubrum aidingense JCM 13560]